MTDRRRVTIKFQNSINEGMPTILEDSNSAEPIDGRVMNDSIGSQMEFEGLYVISVAARILEMHPQTLRKYERLGLINPNRTIGMLRLYSRDDIRQLMLIKYLIENVGLNLAGVEYVLLIIGNLETFKERLNTLIMGDRNKKTLSSELEKLFSSFNLPIGI
jgi:MerR family transcriptional regulator, heat shock protein HspR|tara:strand:- start:809 stop:1291 length:483 start_codon:yes stop_codon:yes gene_type:complete